MVFQGPFHFSFLAEISKTHIPRLPFRSTCRLYRSEGSDRIPSTWGGEFDPHGFEQTTLRWLRAKCVTYKLSSLPLWIFVPTAPHVRPPAVRGSFCFARFRDQGGSESATGAILSAPQNCPLLYTTLLAVDVLCSSYPRLRPSWRTRAVAASFTAFHAVVGELQAQTLVL